jgi:hypothetical protein
MSWEIFKQNILRVANNPEGISDISVIAELYAKEYDAAVKRGFDKQHKIPLVSGNVEIMKQLFASALQKGVNSSQPYDLVGEMGEGVKAYWAGAIMATTPLPITPAIQATSNVSVTQNIVTNPGVWQKPILSLNLEVDTELTPEKRVEYQEALENELENYNQFIADNKELEATAILDAVNKFTSILDENKDYNTEVPIQDAILGIVPGTTQNTQKTLVTASFQQNTLPNNTPTSGELTEEELAEFLSDGPVGGIDSGVKVSADNFSTGKPFVQGFKAGGGFGGGGGGGGAPYVPFNEFKGNMSVGEKAIAIAVYDAGQNIVENPNDRGPARLIQMQAFGNGKWGGAGDRGFAWCACAVTTWWAEAGFDVENLLKFGPNYNGKLSTTARHFYWPGVPQWVLWGIDTGRYVDMKNEANAKYVPKAGDAIIYDWSKGDNGASNHIGLFWKIESGKWWGVDGNKGAPGAIRAHCIKDMGAVQAIIRI